MVQNLFNRAQNSASETDLSSQDPRSPFGKEGLPLIDWEPVGVTRHVAEEVTEAVAKFRNDRSAAYRKWQDQTEEALTEWIDPTRLDSDAGDECLSPDDYQPPSRARLSPIASGGLVVASTEFSKRLGQQNRNFAAVEMEAAGVMASVDRTDGVNAMIIRGISDFADEKKSDLEKVEDAECRKAAVFSAATYLRTFLSAGFLQRARPTVERQKQIARQERRKFTEKGYSADTLEITHEGGPATSFIRQHELASDSITKPASEASGITVAVELEVMPNRTFPLTAIRVEMPALQEPTVIAQRVTIDGIRIPNRGNSHSQFESPYTLNSNEQVILRVERRFQSEKSYRQQPEFDSATDTEIVLEIPGSNGKTHSYYLDGWIGPSEGL